MMATFKDIEGTEFDPNVRTIPLPNVFVESGGHAPSEANGQKL